MVSAACLRLYTRPLLAPRHPHPDPGPLLVGWRGFCATPAAPQAPGVTMKAAVYRAFGGTIEVEDIPIPTAPAGGVVVEVRATGVCRSDWHGWKGHDSDVVGHGLPFTPGHELSGVVAAVGEGVQKFRAGDRVAVPFILSCGACRECRRGKPTVCEHQEQPGFTRQGSFAQFVALPRADLNLCLLPEAVSFNAAAALGCRFTTAFRAVVQQGRLQAGEAVAVFGCGGVGLSCVMVAAAYGAKVVAVDTCPDALARAASLGAHTCVDAAGSREAVAEAVRAATEGGVGADVSVDAAGLAATCEGAVYATRRGGRMVQVGLPLALPVPPAIPMARVAGWELELIGSHGCAASDFPEILWLVEKGRLDPEKLVAREVGLADGARELMAMDHGSPGGITLITSFGP